jgi:putative transposase
MSYNPCKSERRCGTLLCKQQQQPRCRGAERDRNAMQRIPPSQRLSQQLAGLLQEGLSSDSNQSEVRSLLIRFGIQRILQELLEAEQRDFLGVDRYERGSARHGQRNGYAPTHVDTGEGRIGLEAPQVRNSAEPFQSQLLAFLKGRTDVMERLVSEMYAHGLSTRDIEMAFTDATGGCVISRSVVSEVTERLWQEYQAFREQRWEGVKILYLFADGLYEPMRATGSSREAILCLWAICGDGRKRLLDVVLGNRESRDAWLESLRGLVSRGLQSPVLMTSDGAPGLTAALEQIFPEALRQRCLVHKTRNITQKVSAADLAAVKADVLSAYHASQPEVARLVADVVAKKWQPVYPSAMASFVDDFEACIAYLRCPPAHHKFIRTTNLAERAIEEERRRTKTIPRFFDEKSCLKLCFASLLRASRRWQRVTISEFDRTRLDLLREQLHQEYLARRGQAVPSQPAKPKEAVTAA